MCVVCKVAPKGDQNLILEVAKAELERGVDAEHVSDALARFLGESLNERNEKIEQAWERAHHYSGYDESCPDCGGDCK